MRFSLLNIFLLDLYNCKHETLLDPEEIKAWMLIAADRMHAEVIGSSFHKFKPWGVSGTVTIAESHLAVHTWPEYNFAAITFETCGKNMDHEAAIKYLIEIFESKKPEVRHSQRGFIEETDGIAIEYRPQTLLQTTPHET